MNIEARIAKLGNLLSKELNSLCVLTENDGLVDVKLGEESVEAVEFFLFLEVGVVLGYSLKGKLVHEVDEFGVRNILLLEASDGNRVSSREKRNLLILWHNLNNFCGNDFEVIR